MSNFEDFMIGEATQLHEKIRKLQDERTELRAERDSLTAQLASQSGEVERLQRAIEEMPPANWLAKWLPEGKDHTIQDLYRLFQQRVLGRTKQLAYTGHERPTSPAISDEQGEVK
jgi:seryl-tRNA synthetase